MKYAYHVTFANRLSTIAERGLVPVGGRVGGAMARGGLAGLPDAKIFLTPAEGIRYWYGKAEDQAHELTMNPYEDGYTPIVLRVPLPSKLERDEVGEKYSGVESWSFSKPIAPEKIEVWSNGADWEQVEEETGAHWVDADLAYASPDKNGRRFFARIEDNGLADVAAMLWEE